ncbi:tetrahydroberberine oxidase-like [Typha angustifolia]|uniref:tetrahydroberberine oxidase-like n=1 Tax=Typha angustifolia TaxID=59011 RepID=UPI003C305DF9
MAPISILHFLVLLLRLSISTSSPQQAHESFLNCLSIHLPGHNLSQLIYTPNTPSYSSLLLSSIQNLRFTSSANPLLIISPEDALAIQASVICCKKHSLLIRIRSGGHDYEGLSYRSDDGDGRFVMLDLAKLRSVNVDIRRSTAWVQSGATIGELYYKIGKSSRYHGFPAGTCPTVAIGGQISGGGLGRLVRKYGMAADSVLDAELVDANGRLLDRASMGEELFWAIRGGGGASFGVIISWNLGLVGVPHNVTVVTLHKSKKNEAIQLVYKWQYIAHKLHEDLYLKVDIVSKQGKKRGAEAVFIALFLGRCSELLYHMEKSFPGLGVEREDCREMSWIESVIYFAGYTNGEPIEILVDRSLQPKEYNKGKSDYVKDPIPLREWEGIWEMFLKEGAGSMYLNPQGGRMSKISESEIPYPHRQGNLYNIQYAVRWKESGDVASEKHLSWIRDMYRYMSPYVSKNPRAAYINFRDLDLGKNEKGNSSYSKAQVWGRKYFKDNFRRLAMVKSKVDPDEVFWNEQSIPPLIKRISFKELMAYNGSNKT